MNEVRNRNRYSTYLLIDRSFTMLGLGLKSSCESEKQVLDLVSQWGIMHNHFHINQAKTAHLRCDH